MNKECGEPKYIVYYRRNLTLLAQHGIDVAPVSAYGEVAVGLISNEAFRTVKHLNVDGLLCETYLDRFIVATFDEREEDVAPLTEALFRYIAATYEEWIDRERNVENIEILLSILISEGSIPIQKVLDFGCGIGLAQEPASTFAWTLVCYDLSPEMRRIAANQGLIVWGPNELLAQQPGSVDGAFASYVFDVIPTREELELVWRCIANGGLLVGNFHKGRGLETVTQVLVSLGAIVIEVEPASDPRHGTYLAYRKPML